jgi:hypothetical protein
VGWTVNVGDCGWAFCASFADLGVITAGDEIRVATFADVLQAVSPIETRDEAAAALLLQNGELDCNANNVRPDSDGWTFKKTQSFCGGEVREQFWHVTRDGKVTRGATKRLEKGDTGRVCYY